MKKKISISISEETLQQVEKELERNTFRNKSHLIELSIQKLLSQEAEK